MVKNNVSPIIYRNGIGKPDCTMLVLSVLRHWKFRLMILNLSAKKVNMIETVLH